LFIFFFVINKKAPLFSHWRKNKSLRFILRTKQQMDIKTNTRVIILAGNENNPCAALKNNVSWFRGGQAEFNDLRFLGASGRGLNRKKSFCFFLIKK
jgi:hypothetical protein